LKRAKIRREEDVLGSFGAAPQLKKIKIKQRRIDDDALSKIAD
jgi:hypothetical protein